MATFKTSGGRRQLRQTRCYKNSLRRELKRLDTHIWAVQSSIPQAGTRHRGIDEAEVNYPIQFIGVAVALLIFRNGSLRCKGLCAGAVVVSKTIERILFLILRSWRIRKGSGISFNQKHWYRILFFSICVRILLCCIYSLHLRSSVLSCCICFIPLYALRS